MAIAILSGFETGDAVECTTVGTFSVQGTVTAGAWSAYALRTNPTTTSTGAAGLEGYSAAGSGASLGSLAAATIYVRFAFRIDTLPAANNEIFFSAQTTAGGSKLELRVDSTGNISAYNGTTLIATGTAVLSTGTWYTIYAKCGTGNGAVVEWKVAVGGGGTPTTDVSTTANLSTTNYGIIRLGKFTNRNGQSVDFYFDDVCVSTSAYPAYGQVTALVPNADGNYQTWTIGAGAGNHYEVVDERPTNTTDYLTSTGVAGDAETEGLTSTSSAGISGTVNVVKSQIIVLRDGASAGSLFLRLRSGSTDSDTGSAATTNQTALNFNCPLHRLFETDPATSAAWTVSALDNVEVGAIENSVNKTRMTGVFLMVDWAPGPFTGTAALAVGAATTSASATFTASGGTYTASASLSPGAATSSSSAAFTKPTYSATSDLTVAPSALAASATFTAPRFTATAAPTVGHTTASSSASFAPGTKTATAAPSAAPATLAADATFAAPIYTATSVLTSAPTVLAASATFTQPTFAATADLQAGPTVSAASATFTKPTYTATAGLSVAPAVLDSSAAFAPGTKTATATLTAAHATLAASGAFTEPVYTAAADMAAGPAVLSASATFVRPTFRATSALTAGHAALDASVTFVKPTYTGTAALSARGATLTSSATFASPLWTATADLGAGPVLLAASGTVAKPVYSGVADLISGSVSLVSSGTFVKPVYTGTAYLTAPAATFSSTAIRYVPYGATVSWALAWTPGAAAAQVKAPGSPVSVYPGGSSRGAATSSGVAEAGIFPPGPGEGDAG